MLTTNTIIESTITYGIVHVIWVGLHLVSKKIYAETRKERNRIIHNHVETGHQGRLKHCLDEACTSLRKPAMPQPEQAVRTES